MREILFKAKRLDNGEWVEGGCVHQTDYYGKKVDKWFIVDGATTEDNDIGFAYEVDPNTVCQYTGLIDIKGKKVFEGDVLRLSDEASITEWKGVITFGNPNGTYTWGWQITHVSGDAANTDTLLWFDMEEGGAYSVVIGNIHDKEAQECSV